ncbi:MAG: hypothetical protein M1536_01160 [Firmicutes bacterium]|nr:hypothetical protein [Bacillota bacterium]
MRKVSNFFVALLTIMTAALILVAPGSLCLGARGSASSSCSQETAPPSAPSPEAPAAINNAKELLDAMQKAVNGVVDYSLTGYLNIENENMVIDYKCVRPSMTRTQILQGSETGAVILYIPDKRKDAVRVKKGAIRVWRSIKTRRIENTIIVESMLDTLLKRMKNREAVTFKGKFTLKAHVGDTFSAVLNPIPATSPAPVISCSPSASPRESPSPVKSLLPEENASPWAQPRTIDKECYLLEIRHDGFVDTVAIDAETLWLIYAKRMEGDQLVSEIVVTGIKTNTYPKMEL